MSVLSTLTKPESQDAVVNHTLKKKIQLLLSITFLCH